MHRYVTMGTIYLLHFDQKIGRSQHYLGWTRNLDHRLEDHRAGRGGKTTARFRAAGIGFELAAQWSGSPDDEKRLKNKSLRSLCSICKEKTMTVLEVMQHNADATRKVNMSLTDLTRATKNSRSRVRQELKALLDEGKMTVASKGDAGQNKTVYELALCVPLPATVQENCAQHSAAQSNRIAEQDTTKFADSIELGTVPPHSAARTVPTSVCPQSPGPLGDGGCGQNPEVSRATSMPPALLFFKDVEGIGPCLDLTRHYIADLELVNLALRYPESSSRLHSGMLRVLHIPYRDSRVEDTFHAILFFFGEDLNANFCRGHKLDSTSLRSLCRAHTLTYHLRNAFPTTIEVHAQACRIDQYAQALYDVRRFCIHCAGSSLPAGMFPGFEYVPYERPVSPNVSTPQSVADPSSSAGPKQDSAHADRVAVAVVRQNVARATLQRLLSIWRNAFGLDSRLIGGGRELLPESVDGQRLRLGSDKRERAWSLAK
jgi:predicted GIY-YIG superfamily endonuclease